MSILIYDWDDTFFPTTQYETQRTKVPLQCKSYDSLLVQILKLSVKMSSLVVILSNGSKKWIQDSLTYLPMTKQYLKTSKILIISARDAYSSRYPNNPVEWKKRAIIDLLKNKSVGKIISIGDSHVERVATNLAAKILDVSIVITVKLIDEPTFGNIISQLETILTQLTQWSHMERSVSVVI